MSTEQEPSTRLGADRALVEVHYGDGRESFRYETDIDKVAATSRGDTARVRAWREPPPPTATSVPGCSDAYVERSLGLPAGTLRSWEGGNLPPEGRTLMRILQSFPWMVEVADAGFDRFEADLILLRETLRSTMPRENNPVEDVVDLLHQIVAVVRASKSGDPSHLLCSALASLALERLGLGIGLDEPRIEEARESLERCRAARAEPAGPPKEP